MLGSIAGGVLLLAAFVAWELRAPAPMLPMRFFRNRAFAATNGVSLAMFFGAFGSIFLLAQFFQVAQGYSPLEAGIRTLPWTAMPIFVAPVAGILSDRIGSRPLMAAGLALQAAGAGVARAGHRAGRGLRAARAGLRDGRHGHGARVRPGGQRRAELGAAERGRTGVRRHEHDPRDRRRARRGGAGHRVHASGGMGRRRPTSTGWSRRLGRRGGAGGRGAGRAAGPGARGGRRPARRAGEPSRPGAPASGPGAGDRVPCRRYPRPPRSTSPQSAPAFPHSPRGAAFFDGPAARRCRR